MYINHRQAAEDAIEEAESNLTYVTSNDVHAQVTAILAVAHALLAGRLG